MMRTITFLWMCLLAVACCAQNNLMETRNRLQRECQTPEATWMTVYNLACTDILMTFGLKDEKLQSQLLDEAEKYTSALEDREEADKSEVEALKAFRYLALMNMNPAVNGPRYAGSVQVALEKSQKLNPDNPRAVILSAIYRQKMSAFLHQEYREYESEMARARGLLERQDSTRLAPVWGMDLCR